jgi:ABC-type transport system involved in cytochrome c biogenesis permease subunit
MNTKKSGLWAFVLMAVIIALMAVATWVEHLHGSEYAYTTFYNSTWFTLLWILLASTACYFALTVELYRRIAVFALHTAFLLILLGALITKLTGQNGQVHLRENSELSFFIDDNTRQKVDLPFSLSLKQFKVKYYPGTNSPADYTSLVTVKSPQGKSFEQEISMNHILQYQNFRFYQSSFDKDEQGSILSVSHDPWGIGLSYAGYFLMFVSMLWLLFAKKERFRTLLKKLSQKTVCLLCLAAVPLLAEAAPSHSTNLPTISKEQAAKWEQISVDYNGRICPLQTMANDFTTKITGKDHYHDLTGVQFLFGWLFYPEQWQNEPFVVLKSAKLQAITGTEGTACFADFMEPDGNNKLNPYYHQIYGGAKLEGWLKEASKIDDKIHLIEMLLEGELLKIFPMNTSGNDRQWFSPNVPIPQQTDTMEVFFAQNFFPLYYQSIVQKDDKSSALYLDKLLSFQQKKGGDAMPSGTRITAELHYNRLHLFSLLFKFCLTIGMIGLVIFIISTIRARQYPRVEKLFTPLLVVAFCLATVGLGLRTYIGGRIPVSNGYETMLILAWLSLLTGLLARKYSLLIVVFSFLLAGFTLLVAHISSMSPQMTPLMPVLQSPLLNIHVLTLMVAYGLCGFMTLNSLTAVSVWTFGKNRANKQAQIERMKDISELFMFPATFLMGAGIFIGAIWANVSWGRYWGWDPKEVWALITFLLMSFTFHQKTLKWFRHPMFYHLFVIIIFLAVLMTYFGVNYILGGRHSYAG